MADDDGTGNGDGDGDGQGGTGGDGTGDGDGDGLQHATDRERELAREAANYRRRLREAETQLAEAKRAQQSDAEKALADARTEAAAEVEKTYRPKLLAVHVEAAAAAKLRDPGDAPALLGAAKMAELAELDDDDLKPAIAKAVDALLEAKPYLARDAGNGDRDRRGLEGLVTPGARGTPGLGDRGGGDDDDSWLRTKRKT